MPRAAKAKSPPKSPPKRGSRESIRRQVEDIEKAKSLLEAVDIRSSPDALKDVRALVERLEGELRLGGPKRADPSPAEAAHDAAEELYRAYHGDPEAEEAEIAR